MAARKAAKKRGRGVKAARKRAAKKPSRTGAKRGESGAKLYTLTEIGQMASVSMPTLQKYKRIYQDRIPSVGEGRRQRYPRKAVAVLRQLKKENLAKRGRPRKSEATERAATKTTVRRKKRAAAAGKPAKLLTLTEISRRTKISYPTVSRYVKLFLDRIPHVGTGRKRRFPEEALAAFRQLRGESRPGRPAKTGGSDAPREKPTSASNADLAARLQRLEKAQADLAKQVATVVKLLKRPLHVRIEGR
jgi:excisionase family DNA binding protein